MPPPGPGKLAVTFDMRGRYESHRGTLFGKDRDRDYGLERTRLGLSYEPAHWIEFAVMVQDTRAPWYGTPAPSSLRDPLDFQQAFVELFPASKTGFGASAGRRMFSYGEGRLIGEPEWSANSRTYDHARAYYRWSRARVELLYVSAVKIQVGEFNGPDLSDHAWGAWNVFPDLLWRRISIDAYALHHAAPALHTNTYGVRAHGALRKPFSVDLDGVVQRGSRGPAHAWVAGLSYRTNLSLEYKCASPVFDQLYPSNHNRFGHEDLFGWRNIRDVRVLATAHPRKAISVSFMYNDLWLTSAGGAAYSSSGAVIAQSPAGTAGRHVGRETDLFGTYEIGHWRFGAGGGYLFPGRFLRQATPGKSPVYLYIFHEYAF